VIIGVDCIAAVNRLLMLNFSGPHRLRTGARKFP
jgi:hypothetical protein